MEAKDGTTHGREVEVNAGHNASVGGAGQGGSGNEKPPTQNKYRPIKKTTEGAVRPRAAYARRTMGYASQDRSRVGSPILLCHCWTVLGPAVLLEFLK